MLVAELIEKLYEAPLMNELEFVVKPLENETPHFEIIISDGDNDDELARVTGWER